MPSLNPNLRVSNPAAWSREQLFARWHQLRNLMHENNYQNSYQNNEFELIDAYLF